MMELKEFITGEKTITPGLFIGIVAINDDGIITAGIDDPANPPYYIIGVNIMSNRQFVHIITDWKGWAQVAKIGKDYKVVPASLGCDYIKLTADDLMAIKEQVNKTKTPYIGTEYCKVNDAIEDMAFQHTMHTATMAIINNRGIITNPI